MKTIIKIMALENGAHENQAGDISYVPDGYAEIPETVGTPETLENFPFGDIEVDYTGTHPVVTAWTPLPMPVVPDAPEQEPEPESTVDERLTALEESLALTDEVAIELYEAQAAQEEINAAQDDALIELYEMIGG